MTITIDLAQIARDQGIPLERVQRTVELLDEGNTVPFIARYRKDDTGGLDEEQVRGILAEVASLRQLAERKAAILKSIESLGKLTDELAHQIRTARTSKHLEDLYLPFKPKKQTLATLARQRGLEPFALEILNHDPNASDLAARAATLVNPANKLATVDDVLAGVRHILAEQFSERPDLRSRLRRILQRSGTLISVRVDNRVENNDKKSAAEPRSGARNEARSTNADDLATPNPSRETPATGDATGDAAGDAAAATGDLASLAASSPTTSSPAGDGPTSDFSPNAAPILEATDALSTLESPLTPEEATDAYGGGLDELDAVDSNSDSDSEDADEDHDENAVEDAEDDTELAEADDRELTDDLAGDRAESAETADSANAEAANVDAPNEAGANEAGATAVTATVTPKGLRATAIPPLKLTARQQARAAARDAKKKKRQKLIESLYKDYYNFKEPLAKVAPHRLLAINRGERSQVLRVRVEADQAALEREALELLVKPDHPHAAFLKECVSDALSRLVVPNLERELRRELTDKAEHHAVDVFIRNLRNLLLQPPVHGRRVLAIDPGFRSGCKLAILDEFGELLDHGTIHIIGPEQHRQLCRSRLVELIRKYQVSVLAIGNGTACRETEQMVAELLGTEMRAEGVEYVIVNEAGASVYSTSPIGREELPKHDATVRSAASIGRRLLDPLSELVKVNPANIGVGLYQNDLKAKHLRDSLEAVVESCVNYVGVDVNTAGPTLLRYVAGLNQLTARRLYEHRLKHGPFHNREELRKVPGFSDAMFIQAAGFLKIYGGDNPLDATWIHPENYEAARRLLDRIGSSEADLALEVTPARKIPTVATSAHESTAGVSVFGGGVAPVAADASPIVSATSPDEPSSPESPPPDNAVSEQLAVDSPATEPTASEPTASEPTATEPTATEPTALAASVSEATASEVAAGPPRVPLAERLAGLNVTSLAGELSIGVLTLRDMLAALSRPRRDSREDLPPPVFRRGIVRLEDLAPGMELSGTVLNVVDFGVFVDIGLSDSALIHISRLADRFVKDPHEVVGIGDVLKVWVVEVDTARRRVSLTAIAPGSERPREARPPRGEGFQGAPGDGRGDGRGDARGDGRGSRRGGPPGAQGPGQGGGQGAGPAGGRAPGGAFGRTGPVGGRPGGDRGGPQGGDRGGQRGGDRGGPGRGPGGPGGFGGQRGPTGNTAGSNAGPAASGGGRGGYQGERRGGGRGGPPRGGYSNRQPVQQEFKSKKAAPDRAITKGMIEGVEPMRTFGDLMQFYQKKKEGDDNDAPGPKPKS